MGRSGVEQIPTFVSASTGLVFEGQQGSDVYGWVERVLREQGYRQQGRAARGLDGQRTGDQAYSAAGVQRVRPDRIRAVSQHLGGPALPLRKRATYRQRRSRFTKTNPTQVAIGERRRPEPNGRPGYLRVDTVHQGDCDGVKGVYHINAVDEVTQWQVVGCTPAISEAWLERLLESMLKQFPFVIHGFHSDNGSEFVNHTVANLLGKLLIEQTRAGPGTATITA